ncbi:MAG: SRPBCC family protein [Bacteroidota bacterium]
MILLIATIFTIFLLSIGFSNAQKLRNIHIQKEVLIAGSLTDVYEQVIYLSNFPNWSPFMEADPDQQVKVVGEDGKVGAQYHWVGNKGKDVGFQEIVAFDSFEYVKMQCDIQKPFKARPIFEYHFQQMGSQVKVTQDFTLHSGTVDAFFMWIFGAKKDMEKMNQRGLDLLKETVEGQNEVLAELIVDGSGASSR